MEENKNPLSSYGVTDEQFEFYEAFYKHEVKAFWKGFFTVLVLVILVPVIILLLKRVGL